MTRFLSSMGAAVACLTLLPAVGVASRTDQKTTITIHEQIEVPGAVLAPGQYTIELLDSSVDNNVVLFRDDDGKIIESVVALPAQRNSVTGETKFSFYETPMDEPPALRTWFYPGAMNGHEFVYPESRGREIAKHARRNVPTGADKDLDRVRKAGSSGSEPVTLILREVTFYSLSPDSKKGDLETGRAMNAELDRRAYRPGEFLGADELEESRIARQIRKEIVTLPYYSLWDHIEYRLSDDGRVELMGSVYRPSLKKSIERVVERVEGVSKVENKIEILPTSPLDDDIRRAAYRSIYGHPSLQNYQLRSVPPIHIIVSDGNITLEGVVNNRGDRNIAGIQANSVSGAFKVTNNLSVEN